MAAAERYSKRFNSPVIIFPCSEWIIWGLLIVTTQTKKMDYLWGTGVYSNDTALDAKDTYLSWLEGALTDEEALEKTLLDAPKPEDDDECEFWLALALTQWKMAD